MTNKTSVSKAESKKEIGSAFDLLSKSWDIVKNNWQMFALVNILSILGAIAAAVGTDETKTSSKWSYQSTEWSGFSGLELGSMLGAGAVLLVAFIIVNIFLYAMTVSLELKSPAGKKPGFSELFDDGKKYFFRIIGVSLLSGLIIGVGLLLFIVPGIIALGRLVMSPYHLVDKNTGVLEALELSNAQAKGRMSKVYAVIGVFILISIAAAIIDAIPVVGPLISVGIGIGFSVILALRYQELQGKTV